MLMNLDIRGVLQSEIGEQQIRVVALSSLYTYSERAEVPFSSLPVFSLNTVIIKTTRLF